MGKVNAENVSIETDAGTDGGEVAGLEEILDEAAFESGTLAASAEPEDAEPEKEEPKDEEPKEPETKGDEPKPPDEPAAGAESDEKPAEEEVEQPEGETQGEQDTPKGDEDVPGFDAAAFAEEVGLDVHLFERCTDERAAFKVLAQSHKGLQKLYGAHTEEVGKARQELKRLTEELDKAKAEKPDKATSQAQGDASEMSDAERQEFLERFDTEPDKAIRTLVERYGNPPENVAELEARVEELAKELRERPVKDADERRFKEFADRHPSWETTHRPHMAAVVQDLAGKWPKCENPYEDVYQLSDAMLHEPDEYAALVKEVEQGVPYATAKELWDLRREKRKREDSAGKRVGEVVDKARTAAAPGTTRGTQPTPIHTNAVGVEEVFDEMS